MNVSSRFDVTGFGVIVTGGASGLGLAYGEVLAAHGARVTLIDVDAGAVAAQASRLRDEGLDVRGTAADVTDHAALDRAIDEAARDIRPPRRRVRERRHRSRRRVRRRLGGRHAAASGGGRARALHRRALEPRDRHQPQRDLRDGARRGSSHAPARSSEGSSSRPRSRRPTVEPAIGAAYMAAKAGARHLMHSIALELAADGITVNAIAPGFFVTNIGGGHAHDPDGAGGGREGHPDASRRSARRHQGARSVPRLAGVRVHHRAGDRDRRRLGAGRCRLSVRAAWRLANPCTRTGVIRAELSTRAYAVLEQEMLDP